MRISWPVLVTVALFVLTTCSVVDSADPALREVLDRAKPMWASVRAASDEAVTYRIVRRMAGDPAFVAKYYPPLSVGDVCYDFAYGPGFVLSETSLKSPGASVRGVNVNYEFQLLPGKGRSSWIVGSVTRIANEQHLADVGKRLGEDMKNAILRHYGVLLDEFLSHDCVKQVKVSDDNGLVKIEYVFDFSAVKKYPFHPGGGEIQKGTLWLDPQHHYGSKREIVHVKVPDGVYTHEIRNELDKTAQGISYVKTMERYKSDVLQITITNEPITAGRPVSDATLTHYGLPEPEWLVARQTQARYRWLTYAAAAVALASAAIWLRKHLRRRAT